MADYRAVNSLSSVDAAYLAGLVDGEGTITLSRKHAREKRQLVVSISNTELSILNFVHRSIGAGKITTKKRTQPHHSPAFTYAIWNRQALNLLVQIQPFLRSYKQHRAQLVLSDYVRLTPRNGKYSPAMLAARNQFEASVLALRAHSCPAPSGRRPAVSPSAAAAE